MNVIRFSKNRYQLLVSILLCSLTTLLKAAPPTHFTLHGAMAAKQGKQGFSAEIHWIERSKENWTIRLNGPLGSGSVLVEQHGKIISFRDGNQTVSSSKPDLLFQQKTGVKIPIYHLAYWVRGLQAPQSMAKVNTDSKGRLITLQQDGFTIEYKAYMQTRFGILPSHLYVKGQNVSVKLIIKQWR